MKLAAILDGIEFISNKSSDELMSIDIEEITYDSRKAKENTLFVAIKGETLDGHDYIESAYDKGCRVFVINDNLKLKDDCVKIIVENSRKALSKMSANFYGDPSKKLKVIGVTGTKGKTTIANYLRTVLCKSGLNTGVIGTNGVSYNDYNGSTANTTPESHELQKLMRDMVDAGVECVAMEVSSGGLMMGRVDDVDFDIGIFTNLSPDHIGPKEHPTFEHYKMCKARLFSLCRYGIINLDDENAGYMIENAKCETTTFSIHRDSHLRAENIHLTRDEKSLGVDFDYIENGEKVSTHICSPGEFSIYNALAVIATCEHLGIDRENMLNALSHAKVDGRVEVIPMLPYATIVLDYAHNGMSMENVLETLLEYKPHRIITVFGSVGGRTALRRKELGDVAAKYCQVAVLTTDNPDNEDPMQIINDIAESFVGTDCEVYKIVDRAQAILKALELAEEGDMILITGKGHEKYQYVNGQRVFYDEKAEVIKAAEKVLEEKGI